MPKLLASVNLIDSPTFVEMSNVSATLSHLDAIRNQFDILQKFGIKRSLLEDLEEAVDQVQENARALAQLALPKITQEIAGAVSFSEDSRVPGPGEEGSTPTGEAG